MEKYMDLSCIKAIEIVMDTLDEPDESVVAKKHNVDVEAVKFYSNDPIIAVMMSSLISLL